MQALKVVSVGSLFIVDRSIRSLPLAVPQLLVASTLNTDYIYFCSALEQSRMSALFKVLDKRRFGHVNRQLTDVGHVIANPLQVLGYKK